MNKIKGLGGLAALLTLAIGLSSTNCDFIDPGVKSRRIAENHDPAKADTVTVRRYQSWSGIAKSICPEGVHIDDVGAEMKKLNPQIKSIHMIYPGQKIAVPDYSTRK